MNKTAMWAIAKKDMQSIIRSVRIWLPMCLIPLLLGVISPSMIIVMVGYGDFSQIAGTEWILELINQLKETTLHQEIERLPTLNQKMVYLFITYLFPPCFLVIPIMASSVVAANSFVGEKERKTLESLLLSPINMLELFVGKVLSALIPAYAITLLMFILFGVSINLLTYPLFQQMIFPTWDWILLIIWVVPAVSLFVILFNVLISSKVKGFQEAYQLGSVIVIPIAILIVSQMTGYFFLSTWRLFMIGLSVFVIDLFLIRWVAKGNQRLKLGEKYL